MPQHRTFIHNIKNWTIPAKNVAHAMVYATLGNQSGPTKKAAITQRFKTTCTAAGIANLLNVLRIPPNKATKKDAPINVEQILLIITRCSNLILFGSIPEQYTDKTSLQKIKSKIMKNEIKNTNKVNT